MFTRNVFLHISEKKGNLWLSLRSLTLSISPHTNEEFLIHFNIFPPLPMNVGLGVLFGVRVRLWILHTFYSVIWREERRNIWKILNCSELWTIFGISRRVSTRGDMMEHFTAFYYQFLSFINQAALVFIVVRNLQLQSLFHSCWHLDVDFKWKNKLKKFQLPCTGLLHDEHACFMFLCSWKLKMKLILFSLLYVLADRRRYVNVWQTNEST